MPLIRDRLLFPPFRHLFSGSPLTFSHLSLVQAWPPPRFLSLSLSLCGHRPRRADSCLLLAPPFRLLLAFLSNTAGNLSFRLLLSLSRERSVFIVLSPPFTPCPPTFRLGAILPVLSLSLKGFVLGEGESEKGTRF